MTKPTTIERNSKGRIILEEWVDYLDRLHRIDGPAFVSYHNSGGVRVQSWRIRGKFHRIEGPAYVEYWENGNLRMEDWNQNGIFHRNNGPASVVYLEDGTVEHFYYMKNGVDISSQVKEYLEENGLRDPLNIPVDHQLIMKLKFW